jgi:hypothetical protein
MVFKGIFKNRMTLNRLDVRILKDSEICQLTNGLYASSEDHNNQSNNVRRFNLAWFISISF